MKQTIIAQAIQDGLTYLSSQQNDDGGFTSYLSTDQYAFTAHQPVRTVFIPAVMLTALARIPEFNQIPLKNNLVAFLLNQKSPHGSYNYWTNDEPLRHARNYPDDLDDTFCALTALYYADQTLITPETLVSMVKILIATEKSVGGPYRTWIVPEDSPKVWLDVDPAVNSNVAHFLSLISDVPAGLRAFLEQSVSEDALLSPYYPSVISTLYYMAHTYTGNTQLYIEKLHLSMQSLQASALYHAMAASTLLRLDPEADVRPWIQEIIHSQRTDGSWPAAGYCIDKRVQQTTYYNGSDTLSTAFALEALALYQALNDKLSKAKLHKGSLTQKSASHSVMTHIKHLDPAPKKILATLLQKLMDSSNGEEVVYLAAKCNDALIKPASTYDHSFSNALAIANLYGWTAYTIYDDFIDEEGSPHLLPAANIAHRISYETFLHVLPKSQSFKQYVRETFDLIDTANTWEVQNCRFETGNRIIAVGPLPNYKNLEYLAFRSLGHTLGPLAVLVKSGYTVKSKSFQHLRTALMHYIIAKQLNDDAHDWQKDFQNGHISYVVTSILQELSVPTGAFRKNDLFRIMQRHFWRHTLITICDVMQHHISLARKALKQAACMKSENFIATLLSKIELSIQKTRATQKETLEFIHHFG